MSAKRRKRRISKGKPQVKAFPWIPVLGILTAIGVVIATFLFLTLSKTDKPPVTVKQTPEETLGFLITTHPKTEIRNDLDALFRSRAVRFSFEFFRADPKDLPLAQFLISPALEAEGLYLVFYFNLDEFVQNRSYSDLAKQSIILHEYEHYLQWKTGRYPAHTFVAGFQFNTREEVTSLINGELEAYIKGCDMAIEYDAAREMDLCANYEQGGIPLLRKDIALTIAGKIVRGEIALTLDERINLLEFLQEQASRTR